MASRVPFTSIALQIRYAWSSPAFVLAVFHVSIHTLASTPRADFVFHARFVLRFVHLVAYLVRFVSVCPNGETVCLSGMWDVWHVT